jgi:hypothetical protein
LFDASNYARRCPGVHFANVSLFLGVTSLLATFTFSKKRDAQGNEITPKVEYKPNSFIM